jgi:hypothetical protein
MKFSLPFQIRAWTIAPACACVFLVCIAAIRIRHLDYLATAGGVVVTMDPRSPTGYAGGVRGFVPASRDTVSLEPIAQTQQMLARGDLRVRHVDYDNAPAGREVLSTSPYLWWLGAVAVVHGLFSSVPLAVSVERAALFADPLLHLLAIAGTAMFVARRFGSAAAVVLSIAMAALVPFAAAFAPGQPRVDGFAAIAALWSVLLILAALRDGRSEAGVRRDFFAAGLVGGFLLWLDAGAGLPVVAGIAVGAHASSWSARKAASNAAPAILPWRCWAAGGAIACLVGYVVEFLPDQAPGMRLDVVHPLHGLAWLGTAELIARADGWLRRTAPFRLRRDVAPVVLAVATIVVPLVLAFQNRRDLFGPDTSLLRLTPISEGAVASGLWTWLAGEGFTALAFATLAPLAILVPLAILTFRGAAGSRERAIALLALGPIVVTLVVASIHLRRWVVLDGALFAGLVVSAAASLGVAHLSIRRWAWAAAIAVLFVPGVIVLMPKGPADAVSEPELASLIERDLAHWLAKRTGAGRAAVIASPGLAASLAFQGGFSTLGSPYRENRAGFDLSLRIAGTGSQDEALALVTNRGLTHVVLASWDRSLEEFAKLGDTEGKSLAALLHQWLSPRWLRPVPYPVPQVPGAEAPEVLVFEVVEVQDNSVALSAMAEYFVETRRIGLAGSASVALGRMFPENLGAQVARAKAASAAGLRDETNDAFNTVMKLLEAKGDANLPWDRRVSLTLLLADAKMFEHARAQLVRSIDEIDETRLRSLTPLALHRFVTLADALELKPADPRLWELARNLMSH